MLLRITRGTLAAALLLIPATVSAQDGHDQHAAPGEHSTLPTPLSATGPADDVVAVTQVVQALFDGMRAADSAMIRPLFHPDARMVATGMRGGVPVVMVEDVDGFIGMVGATHEQVYDEHIDDLEVRVDQNLAMAWMSYDFYLGDQFSHCGVDLMHLVRTADGWRIIELGDTRRREGCR